MTAAVAAPQPSIRHAISIHPRVALRDIACWTVFAAAAILFVVDAMATIQVVAMQPFVMEQNPIARWTLGVHPAAPYILKAAIVAECAVVVAIARRMDEGWAGYVVSGMMAATGLLGLASAVTALTA